MTFAILFLVLKTQDWNWKSWHCNFRLKYKLWNCHFVAWFKNPGRIEMGNHDIAILDWNENHEIAILLQGSKLQDKEWNWKSYKGLKLEIMTLPFWNGFGNIEIELMTLSFWIEIGNHEIDILELIWNCHDIVICCLIQKPKIRYWIINLTFFIFPTLPIFTFLFFKYSLIKPSPKLLSILYFSDPFLNNFHWLL